MCDETWLFCGELASNPSRLDFYPSKFNCKSPRSSIVPQLRLAGITCECHTKGPVLLQGNKLSVANTDALDSS